MIGRGNRNGLLIKGVLNTRRPADFSFVVISVVFLLSYSYSKAQVVNNNSSESSTLFVDAEPLFSTTDKSTVEWACINKKLTERCLIYHNDQWFTFIPTQSGALFLNVSNQQCKKKFGVQVLVIEGNPCETSSYKLLHCESFTNQSDTFIRLDSMKAGSSYLINIDGFLADVCGFHIQVATKPIGLPHKATSLDTLHLSSTQNKNIITLNWSVQPTLADSTQHFEIYRQAEKEFRNKKLATIPIQFNALGTALTQYSLTDTLTEYNAYTYLIVGVHAQGKSILDKKRIVFHAEKDRRYVAKIPLHFTKKGDVDFLVINALNDQVLYRATCIECEKERIDVDLTHYVLAGITTFSIQTIQLKTRTKSQHTFVLDEWGNFINK